MDLNLYKKLIILNLIKDSRNFVRSDFPSEYIHTYDRSFPYPKTLAQIKK